MKTLNLDCITRREFLRIASGFCLGAGLSNLNILADAFSINRRRKKVRFDVYVEPMKDDFFHENRKEIFGLVRDFYNKIDVDLDFVFHDEQEQISKKDLNHEDHFALLYVNEEEFANRSFQYHLDYNPGFKTDFEKFTGMVDEELSGGSESTKRFIEGEKEKFKRTLIGTLQEDCGVAHPEESTIYMHTSNSFRQTNDGIIKGGKLNDGAVKGIFLPLYASYVCHEIGHLFALWHSHQFLNDPVEEYNADMPNLMSYKYPKIPVSAKSPIGMTLNDYQIGLIHDYLAKGKTYQLFKKADFNYVKYHLSKEFLEQILK
ncbi:MAG: hypothetical protein Q7J54_06920 [Candidatus Woesearchaeota archaeon]|nr:hypothetical protein [Candidatus Woesearchaeota archaeon]